MNNNFINIEQSRHLFIKARHKFYENKLSNFNKHFLVIKNTIYYLFFILFLSINFFCDVKTCLTFLCFYFAYYFIICVLFKSVFKFYIITKKYKYDKKGCAII